MLERIDERGQVQDASFEPQLSAVLNHQLASDAGSWLFLPFVQAGKPVRKSVRLPLKLNTP